MADDPGPQCLDHEPRNDNQSEGEPDRVRRRRKEGRDPVFDLLLPVSAIAAIVFVIIAIMQWSTGDGRTETVPVRVGTTNADGTFTEVELGVGTAGGVDIGDRAPTFSLQTVDGDLVRLEDLQGRIVLVNFWATWCVPCRREVPDLVQLQEEWGTTATIVGVNLQEGPDAVRPFIEDFGVNYLVALDRTGEVMGSYKLFGLPETFFIDGNGVIRDRRIGLLDADTARCVVTSMATGSHEPAVCR